MSSLKAAKTIRELRADFASIRTTVAGDTRFSAQAILFLSERLDRIETLLERQLEIATKATVKPKRPKSAWQKFFAAGMKAGKTPAQIGSEWQARKAT